MRDPEPRNEPAREWWGEVSIEQGASAAWCIGPLRLRASRRHGEWRIVHRPGDPLADDVVEVARPCDPDPELTGEDTVERFAVSSPSDRLEIVPMTADRTIVSRPTQPFHLLPGERVRLFVSSPLWVGIRHGGHRLCELPVTRPSDTWIGSTTGEGEIAYASRTFCRLHLEDLPFRPHRAVTPVELHNQADETLTLERVSIPVPYLSLYAGPDSLLWTEEVELVRESAAGEVDMHIRPGTPSELPESSARVALPRRDSTSTTLRRAWNAFF